MKKAVSAILPRCKRSGSLPGKVMWQSTLVLPVLHPNTTKSYSPDAEKYFDKQYERLFAAPSRLVQCCGLSVASHRAQEGSIVGSDALGCRMLWSQGMFIDGEGTLE